MANLNITTITRPKLPRNKYGYTNNGQVIIGGISYSGGGGSGGSGGDSSGGVTYQDFTGATSSRDGSHGLVPAPSRGQQNYVLHGSGNWRQLFGGHLQYDSETGMMIFDTSVQGTGAIFNDVSVLNTFESLLIKSTTGNITNLNTSSFSSSTGNFKNLNASTANIITINGTTGNIKYVNSSIGNFSTSNSSTNNASIINASTGNIKDINSSIINTSTLTAKDGSINDLVSENIITHNLEVTGLAHFFELVIDRIKAAGGAVIFTPADGFKVEEVEQSTNGYKLYWSATDGDRATHNMWKVNDQAICQSFNQAQVGHNYDISNKYYWSLVTDVSTDLNRDMHYIEISTTVKDGSVNPEIGDEIAMLGYRGTDDNNRQNAIYISAYTSIDPTLTAPLWAHYTGINDFNLSNHKRTWFASNGSNIRGSLQIETGQNITDLLDDIETKTNVDIRIESDKGTTLLVGERSFTLTAFAYYNNEDITSQIAQELFSWERVSADTQSDTLWNSSHVGVGSSINVTDAEVTRKANFCCVVNLDELKRRNIIQ